MEPGGQWLCIYVTKRKDPQTLGELVGVGRDHRGHGLNKIERITVLLLGCRGLMWNIIVHPLPRLKKVFGFELAAPPWSLPWVYIDGR